MVRVLCVQNLVDGLPRAWHIEAIGGPHGGFGPATIDTLDSQKLKKKEQEMIECPNVSFKFLFELLGFFWANYQIILLMKLWFLSRPNVSEHQQMIIFVPNSH